MENRTDWFGSSSPKVDNCAKCCANSETQTDAGILHKRRRISAGISSLRSGPVRRGPNERRGTVKSWLRTFNKFSDASKQHALNRLVDGLTSGLARHLLETIEPRFQVDFVTRLPREIALKCLAYLRPADLHSALLVSRRWNAIASDDMLWRAKCAELDIVDEDTSLRQPKTPVLHTLGRQPVASSSESEAMCVDSSSGVSVFEKVIASQLGLSLSAKHEQALDAALVECLTDELNTECGESTTQARIGLDVKSKCHDADEYEQVECAGTTEGRWKRLFAKQMNVERNWRTGPSRITEVRGHDDHVITCLELFGGLVVSGSDDGTLKVWRVEDGSLVRTLTGHSGGVWASQMLADELLVSGSTDRTVRVWDVRTGECVHVLAGHNSTVRCLHLHAASRRVASGSRDATVRLWHVEAGRCERTLLGHIASVRCVQFDGSLVCSGAYDFTVRVWDAATGACLHTLLGHTNRVYSLLLVPAPEPGGARLLVSGSLDATVRVWHVETGECLHTLLGHQSLTSAIELLDAAALRLLAQQAANAFRPRPLSARAASNCPAHVAAPAPAPPSTAPGTPNVAASRWLVTGNADSTMRIWDLQDGHCVHVLAGAHKHQSALTAMQLVRGMLVSASDDGTVKLWHARTGEFVRDLVRLPSAGAGGVVWRVRASNSRLVCAVGSRNASEPTKLIFLHFDADRISRSRSPLWLDPSRSALAALLPVADLTPTPAVPDPSGRNASAASIWKRADASWLAASANAGAGALQNESDTPECTERR